MSKYKVTLLALTISYFISGCATQDEIRMLRADVDALQAQMQRTSSDAAQALEVSNQFIKETEATRKASEKASADASATRKMLEQINARIGGESGSSTFK